MAVYKLYLTNTGSSTPFPASSRLLATLAPTNGTNLNPGEFDAGLPGTTDSGQWKPGVNKGSTTAADELGVPASGSRDSTTVERGWLWQEQDLTGLTLPLSGVFVLNLHLSASQGSGNTGRVMGRISVVSGSGGSFVYVKDILPTNIVGETSHSNGQLGWDAQSGDVITVSTTSASFEAVFTGNASHTFAANERLHLEIGFGNANSATDRTWSLRYNNSGSHLVTPDITVASTTFTSSALFNALIADTFTASANFDAVIGSNFTASALFNTVIQDTFTASANFNAVVQANLTSSALFNTASVNFDAIVQTTFTASANFDAVVLGSLTASANFDAVVQGSLTSSVNFNTVIQDTLTASVNFDAVIDAGTQSFTASALFDSVIQTTNTASANFNTVVQGTNTASANLNAVIQDTLTSSVLFNAVIQDTFTASVNFNVVIQTTNTASALFNALVADIFTASVIFNAIVDNTPNTLTASVNFDAVIEKYVATGSYFSLFQRESYNYFNRIGTWNKNK